MSAMRCTSCSCADCADNRDCACRCHRAALALKVNRAGLRELDLRVGAHADFLSHALERLGAPEALPELSTRERNDPVVALLDAWAMGADVLTFYRTRLGNDSYLRTTTDTRALRELAALVGHKPRPGLSATTHLAYELDKSALPVEISQGAKAQSVPAPGEQMQTFETDEKLLARAEWNQFIPRRSRPAALNRWDALTRNRIALAGVTSTVRAGDRLLFVFGEGPLQQIVREVLTVAIVGNPPRVELTLKTKWPFVPPKSDPDDEWKEWLHKKDANIFDPPHGLEDLAENLLLGGSLAVDDISEGGGKAVNPVELLKSLAKTPPPPPRSAQMLDKKANDFLSPNSDGVLRLASRLVPNIGDKLYEAWRKVDVEGQPPALKGVFVFSVSASPFGANAPQQQIERGTDEWDLATLDTDQRRIHLDATYDAVVAGSYVVYAAPTKERSPQYTWRIAKTTAADVVGRADYGLSQRTTRLIAQPKGVRENEKDLWPRMPDQKLKWLRSVVVFAGAQKVDLAPDEREDDITGDTIPLDDLYPDIDSGRWIIVTGERTDIEREPPVKGKPLSTVTGGELAMIASVSQGVENGIPGDTPRTTLHLTAPLGFSYKRKTAKIFGNVVKASHGETTVEIIGSGDASRPSQRFTVKRGPLTHTTAETISGLQSSETVRVNGLRYHQVESALDAAPGERAYELELDESGVATMAFTGPLPSGQQNVRASYRVGLGAAGNVRAEQISLATTRPLGVTGVINPLPSAGGAEPDRLEQIRRQAPITAMTMGSASRLVSVNDYALFASRFAGVGQAQATKLSTAAHELVFVTVAGVDDAPLSGSAVLTSLASAYAEFGDPAYAVEIGTRELLALVLEARVTLTADYVWEAVEPAIRKRLLETFSFDRRALAQSIHLSEVVAAIHSTEGVGFVDVDNFGAFSRDKLDKPAEFMADEQGPKAQVVALKARPGSSEPGEILPAQLAYFVPSLPDLLILNFAQGEADRVCR